ncbi:CRISPR system Cascade subunit CasD [Allocatelliglobosispora scoriae]|uniref:CRISPR system Cascade subunit CasD n=1 Tax=Allocatelliglobosispora scoriae TaxID=643052 RepID=A0A841C5W9_9ACTN|nr:type I-E CRISPR-associated protein Cas5/CasD [Allocatelliglobosispora scoriae]MBB5874340.1 CRISPR system Cascade subunit CasD [Allocatelliglobosispora scoriae]
MSVLLLRLAAPLQSWGASSRFAHRNTEIAPTKSGVLGLLAAARGIRRTEPLTELLELRFGVRLDQPGQIIRDFQTARSLDGRDSMPLTYRYYLADAIFLAGVSGDAELLHGLHDALRRPKFPLYLGRRSCPPAGPVSLGVHDGELEDRLDTFDWLATEQFKKKSYQSVRLEIIRDARPGERVSETVLDEPVSFDPAHRQYAWRPVVRSHTDRIANAVGVADDHDPMTLVGG